MRIEGRQSNAEAADALQRAFDKGYVVLTTDVLVNLARENRSAAQSLEWHALLRDLDPEGLHTAHQVMLHNDRDWRLSVLLKVKGSDEPVFGVQDVTMEQWDRLRSGTKEAIARLRATSERIVAEGPGHLDRPLQ